MNEPLQPIVPQAEELAALRAITEGTARSTGQEFFHSLVQHLATAVGARYALVAEFAGEGRARTLGYWFRDHIIDNIEWDLAGTPCEDVVRGNLCHYPTGVSQRFPGDEPMVEWGIDSYLGVPLCDANGAHLGHLAVFDDRPMPAEPRKLFTFRIFAARAAAELERLRTEKALRDSEERYRELYEEAPIAYLLTDPAGTFLEVNRCTTDLLGYTARELLGTTVFQYVPDTEDAQAKARRGNEAFLAGNDLVGVEGEFRRKDGRPLHARIWVKTLRDSAGKVSGARAIWVDITEQVLAEREQARLHQQNLYLQEEIKAEHNFEEIVGRTAALKTVLEKVGRVAATDSTVLITGETGTGKELIARALHSNSKRPDRPLIKINCAALPAGLVESELFGHEKGAFTGAITRRIGRFELAQGGTIFLDEIGELPPEAQAKLLRVLQEREFERVGGTTAIKADVRVIAATNRNLLTSVREKAFRGDLYYRLNVFPIHLPPLRERADDIPLLVQFLVNKFAAKVGKRVDAVDQATLQRLLAYPWPGNVRELENVIERAVILTNGPELEIGADVLSGNAPEGMSPTSPSLEAVERDHIVRVLNEVNWVIEGARGAAKILEMHPNTLRSRMKKLGISRTN